MNRAWAREPVPNRLQNHTKHVQNRSMTGSHVIPSKLDWDDIRVFDAVARAGSLSAGARAAGLDRSTASRRITSLEAAVGARLFLRTPDGLRLSAVAIPLHH